MKVVVDTNVPIVANGQNTHASPACQYKCVDFLERLASLKSKDQILIDNCGLILEEYSKYLSYKGQPGAGDMFFKYLHDNMYQGQLVEQIPITPVANADQGFQELPPNQMDKSDRKFLAVAFVGHSTVVNATDPDWYEQAAFINQLGVQVTQLCPELGCPELTA
jgi:hypothetical protein